MVKLEGYFVLANSVTDGRAEPELVVNSMVHERMLKAVFTGTVAEIHDLGLVLQQAAFWFLTHDGCTSYVSEIGDCDSIFLLCRASTFRAWEDVEGSRIIQSPPEALNTLGRWMVKAALGQVGESGEKQYSNTLIHTMTATDVILNFKREEV